MDKYFEVGVIVNTQGIGGEVRAVPHTDDRNRFSLLKTLLLRQNGAVKEYRIERVRYHKQFVVIKFQSVDTMNDGEKLKNAVMLIPEEQALPLGEDEYYIRDLYGMDVVTTDGEPLGTIGDILATGANDVYVIQKPGEKDLLIPAIKQCIVNVDTASRRMTVRLLEGLRE